MTDPCKSRKTGRIIDFAPEFARLSFDKAIWMKGLAPLDRFREQGSERRPAGGGIDLSGGEQGRLSLR